MARGPSNKLLKYGGRLYPSDYLPCEGLVVRFFDQAVDLKNLTQGYIARGIKVKFIRDFATQGLIIMMGDERKQISIEELVSLVFGRKFSLEDDSKPMSKINQMRDFQEANDGLSAHNRELQSKCRSLENELRICRKERDDFESLLNHANDSYKLEALKTRYSLVPYRK